MKRPHVLVAALTVALLGGCGGSSDGSGTPAKAASAGSAPSPTAHSGFGSVKDTGDIPDPCTLLNEDEVVELTGREITQIDKDDAEDGSTTRFCQWQQEGGQLAIFLSRTTAAKFDSTITGAKPVEGVGEDAFALAGHLYVLYGTVQVDVYSRGGSEQENLAEAREIAKTLFPRI